MFTRHDAKGLHFSHEDAFIVKLMIVRCFVKRILIDTGKLVDIIILSILRHMDFDKGKIEKITLNVVGFNVE